MSGVRSEELGVRSYAGCIARAVQRAAQRDRKVSRPGAYGKRVLSEELGVRSEELEEELEQSVLANREQAWSIIWVAHTIKHYKPRRSHK